MSLVIKTEQDLKLVLANEYLKQIENFFGDHKRAMKFLSAVMSAVQRTPKLIECDPSSLINSFMTMAQLGLMPSDISGEAYVLPYNTKGKMKAQFQLGYQGLITLFYRAGGERLRAEIIRENDQFSYENGEIKHSVDISKSKEQRGKAVGAYAIATVNGQEIAKAMNQADILRYKEFSKSAKSDFTPWNEKQDPELWMWKKTVLKQLGKMLPKNDTINKAIAEDNRDSNLSDQIEQQKSTMGGLTMGDMEVTGKGKIEWTEASKDAVETEVVDGPECTECAAVINEAEESYSKKKYGKVLCRTCQKAQN